MPGLPRLGRKVADIIGDFGQRTISKWEPDRAVSTVERTVRYVVKLCGEDSVKAWQARWQLADQCSASGRDDEAVLLYLQVAKALHRKLGEEDTQAMAASLHAGHALRQVGRSAEAAEMYRRVLGVRERLYGPEDPRTEKVAAWLEECLEDDANRDDEER